MKNTLDINIKERTENSSMLPFLLGVMLGINSFDDVLLIVDGLNCIMSRVEYIFGNHDLYSTLLLPSGKHRITYTMNGPFTTANSEERLISIIKKNLEDRKYSAIFITSLPFQKLMRPDYERIIKSIKSDIPIIYIDQKKTDDDWIEGYSAFLSSIISYIFSKGSKKTKRKNTIAILGNMYDRNEYDTKANISEICRLVDICGYEPIYVFPSGGSFIDVWKIMEAEHIVVLPYIKDLLPQISKSTSAKVYEMCLPLGIEASIRWVYELNKKHVKFAQKIALESMERVMPIISVMSGKNIVYFGEPYMLDSLSYFFDDLNISVESAFLNTNPKKIDNIRIFKRLLFNYDINKVDRELGKIIDEKHINLIVGNCFSKKLVSGKNIPFLEFGFPSYGFHCLSDQPYFGFEGFVSFANRIANSILSTI